MAIHKSMSVPLKDLIFSVLILALTVTCATKARSLDEEVPPILAIVPKASDSIETPVSSVTPAVTAPAAAAGTAMPDHALSFFMHDILGGSNPSARAVTGIVTNPAVNGQVPFAKPNGAVLPVNNGVPVNNANSGIVDNNNIPFLTGLGGSTSNVIQNNGNNINNGGSGFAFLNSAQLQQGTTFQKLMFGTMTIFDDELTEGHELGSGLVGKAQGFYIASSEDGNSQTMAFTTMFKSDSYADSLCFFGVHRTAVSESQLAVMGVFLEEVEAPRAIIWDFLAEVEAPPAKDWSFFFGGEIGNEVEGGDDNDSLFAAAACSGVPYFLGLPLFFHMPSDAEGTE
ncbi:hypothetical protein F0562_001268 [Nyssa sinensis]|uniref:Dirigent protein n=1 Tax=Nyssa sinensis TaxID=561372 RepID=A0A5J5C4F7_9ASTE|nr:hypothetical protein F0562_001268 [Nyssa sinensis]